MATRDLHHFYASALLPAERASSRFSWSSVPSAVTTLRIYAHLWPGEEGRTRTVMDAVLGGRRTGCGQVGDETRETTGQMA
ncbi:hypothetical protein [Streptomyces sp. NPDC091209]|uniref:hypothetical protein n=1 Tax=Streptomyces sp. NPDC091209 TaxID=3365974 RepID=UPI003829EEBC